MNFCRICFPLVKVHGKRNHYIAIAYRKSLNRSSPQIDACLNDAGGIAEVSVVGAGLKLKPEHGLHVYEARLRVPTCLQWQAGVMMWCSS